MNDILNYFVKSLVSSTLSLKKKGILIEKPWALLDEDGEVQKLIFKRDKGLILSKNGKVTEGSWDYYPEAKALFVDRGKDKLLLKEQFIDENVLILKMDGTKNDFYALANENVIPDYNIPKYLNSLKCKELRIYEKRLLNGNIIQIHAFSEYNGSGANFKVEQFDHNYRSIELPDGSYISDDKLSTFYVRDSRITAITSNILRDLLDGETIEIEDVKVNHPSYYKSQKITLNGNPIPDKRLVDKYNYVYEIKQSKIAEIFMLKEYSIIDGSVITIEQKDFSKIKSGDKIVDAKPVYPIPDGKYKIKGRMRKIKVIDCTIVV